MKFRIMSDLHVDVNERFPLRCMEDGEKIFTLIAGDISGDPVEDFRWLRNNTDMHGAFVSGNHIVYNFDDKTIQELQEALKVFCPNEDGKRWRYLEKDHIVLEDEKTVIVGSTLWTDYKYGGPDQNYNMLIATKSLNDFRWGKISHTESLTPQWCLEEHKKSLEYIDKICNEYKDYDIVVLSHHAPSEESIAPIYKNKPSNGAYVSDLKDFILNHSNIKLWVHGHVHNFFEYEIGDCKVICNPRGYVFRGESRYWTPNVIYDMKTKYLTITPIEMSKEEKEDLDKQDIAIEKLLGF